MGVRVRLFSIGGFMGFLLAVGLLLGDAPGAVAASCVTSECHAAVKQPAMLHAPVEEDECKACHKQQTVKHPGGNGKNFRLKAEGAKLCYRCHDTMGKRKNMHAPVKEGDCLACHNAHGSEGASLLPVGENQKDLCLGCHDTGPFAQPFGHGPVELGVCTYCHSPHESAHGALLREKPQALCLGCHADFAVGIKKARYIHSAIEGEECSSCHQVHGSGNPGLLKRKGEDLCFQCHGDIGEKFNRATSRHAVLYQGDRCGNCHLVHFAEKEKLLFEEEMALCLDCHGHDGKGTRNIEREIEGKEYLHGPVADKQCTPCHDPHGSFQAALLRGPYPGSFYTPYQPGIYGFCFDCHGEETINSQGVASKATNFRNGEVNLHALHVADERKGRSCRSCHESHASEGPMLISRDGTPFGSWRIPIRFKQTDSGGSCVPGCHGQAEYDRQKPVLYKGRQNEWALP